MNAPWHNPAATAPEPTIETAGARNLFFSQIIKLPVRARGTKKALGKVTDLVFAVKEPYPEAVGIYLEHGWGQPTEFIPWDRVLEVGRKSVVVMPTPDGQQYPPFVDQPGWLLLDQHLMGKDVLDLDGRRVEVVNDVQLLDAKGRMLLVQVDMSFNGFLRRWGLKNARWMKDDFISWKFVQPLSHEDALATDRVSLSITKNQLAELPPQDLADALEELSGKEQEALFSALDPETAAETLMEAEPRARRQIIADLRRERAKQILTEMSVPQLANLLSVLPHDDASELLELVPEDEARRIKAILADQEARAGDLMDQDFMTFPRTAKVGPTLAEIRISGRDQHSISYVYVTGEDGRTLVGCIDLRELVLAPDPQTLGDIMASPVVTAETDDTVDDLTQLFAKYHYRMVPVTDAEDHILGVVRFNDIMKGPLSPIRR